MRYDRSLLAISLTNYDLLLVILDLLLAIRLLNILHAISAHDFCTREFSYQNSTARDSWITTRDSDTGFSSRFHVLMEVRSDLTIAIVILDRDCCSQLI